MPKTVTIRLRGGLGNQLFQYAAARNLSIKESAETQLDCRDLILKNERPLGLKFFNLVSHSKILDIGRPPSWAHKIYKKATGSIYSEPAFNYSDKFNNLRASIYLEGYFQSEKYFLENETQIRDGISAVPTEAVNINRIAAELMPETKTVSLHVRRGDYTKPKNLKIHGVLSPSYYVRALETVNSSCGPGLTVCVFTDDVNWVEKNLQLPAGTRIISKHTNSMIEDLFLMARCDHHIIANSSFSWWGAWLNPSKSKVVVAPKQWFTEAASLKINTVDLCPPAWIRI
jgi:hypothetical protein